MQPEEKIRLYVVEDDPLISESIRLSLVEFGYEVVGLSSNGEQALTEIPKTNVDIVLLDIEIEGNMSGIDIGASLSKMDIPFIYLTSYGDDATIAKAKTTKPAGYILKPFNETELKSNIEITFYKYLEAQGPAEETPAYRLKDSIFVRHKSGIVRIQLDEISYLESEQNYTKVITAQQSYMLASTLKVVEAKLQGTSILRVHRSYMVNLEFVEGISEGCLVIGDKAIPVGRIYKDVVMSAINLI